MCTALLEKLLFVLLQKLQLVAKNEFAFSFRPTEKTNKWAANMLMFHVDFNIKQLGIRLKTTSFNEFQESTLSFERQ